MATPRIDRSKYQIAAMIRDILKSDTFPPGEYSRAQIAEGLIKTGLFKPWEVTTNLNRLAITAGWLPNGANRAAARVVKPNPAQHAQTQCETAALTPGGGEPMALRMDRMERMLNAICRDLGVAVEEL